MPNRNDFVLSDDFMSKHYVGSMPRDVIQEATSLSIRTYLRQLIEIFARRRRFGMTMLCDGRTIHPELEAYFSESILPNLGIAEAHAREEREASIDALARELLGYYDCNTYTEFDTGSIEPFAGKLIIRVKDLSTEVEDEKGVQDVLVLDRV